MGEGGRPTGSARTRRRFRDLVEGLGAVFWELDPTTWQFTFVSRRAEEILGYPVERWLAEPHFWVTLIHPDDRESIVTLCRAATQEGRDHEFEYRGLAADGRVVWLRDTVYVVRDREGRAWRLRGVLVDITARRRAEEALQARAREQAAIADLGQLALAGLELGRLLDEAVGLVARTLEVECAKVLELLPDGTALLLRAGVGWKDGLVGRATVEMGRKSQAGYTLLSQGPVIVEDWRTETRFSEPPLHQGHGLTSGVTVIIHGREGPFGVLGAHASRLRAFTQDDIRFLQAVANVLAIAIQRKRAEEEREQLLRREQTARAEAEAAQRRAAFLAEASRQLAASLDYEATLSSVARLAVAGFADYCIVYLLGAGKALRRVAITHADPANAGRARDLQSQDPPDPNGPHPVAKALRTGQSELLPEIPDPLLAAMARTPENLEVLRKLGPRSAVNVPLVARGRTFGVLTFVLAESGRRYGAADVALAEEVARRAAVAVDNACLYQETQEAVRVRDEFLARASHELRTPLTVVSGHLALLGKRLEGAGTEAGTLISTARRHIDRMVRLLSDLLDASRLAAGRLALEPEPLELGAVVAEALAQAGPLARERGVGLLAAVPAGLVLVGDRLKLEQVVLNLLTNAIKYTGNGGTIRADAQVVGGHLELRVRDTGEGIAREHLERIFEPFFQVSSGTGRRKAAGQGTGLGLAICRQIVQLHGGQIWAESDGLGRGSTFTVRLPVASAEGRAA